MSLKNDGGQAFPMAFGCDSENYPGMSLRDYFAGQALSGLLASGHFTLPNDEEERDGAWMTTHPDPYDENGEERHPIMRKFDFPEAAWRCADAMLSERELEGGKVSDTVQTLKVALEEVSKLARILKEERDEAREQAERYLAILKKHNLDQHGN